MTVSKLISQSLLRPEDERLVKIDKEGQEKGLEIAKMLRAEAASAPVVRELRNLREGGRKL